MKEENIKLLMVDDERVFLNNISQRLELKGFKVKATPNGEEAIKAALEDNFDVAVVDLNMPGISGQELLTILKNKHPFLQVLILTGYGSMSTAMECMRMGAFTFIEKPYQLDQLVEAIKDAYTAKQISKYQDEADKLEAKNTDKE